MGDTHTKVITKLTKSPREAAEFIRNGGLVAFPTETVYGLGADIFNESAIEKIYLAKRRPADNPLIAHVATRDQIDELASQISTDAAALIKAFFPGPLTLVLRKRDGVPMSATAGLDTIGIRIPGHDVAHEFLTACETPVVAPSANLSGRPSPTTWLAVQEDLGGAIDCILQGDPTEIGLESTVVDCVGETPVILRLGAVSYESLREIVPAILDRDSVETDDRRSPGLRHRHYSPRAQVILIRELNQKAPGNSAYIGLSKPDAEMALEMVCGTVDEYAARLFEFFRECDRRGIQRIYCELVDKTGIGAALNDRLRRAAEK